jgi:hypothetical protein
MTYPRNIDWRVRRFEYHIFNVGYFLSVSYCERDLWQTAVTNDKHTATPGIPGGVHFTEE